MILNGLSTLNTCIYPVSLFKNIDKCDSHLQSGSDDEKELKKKNHKWKVNK